jgi:hypothetical protein
MQPRESIGRWLLRREQDGSNRRWAMMTTNSVDRQALRVWLLLVVLGTILLVVGWYRWAT